jgi:hypothetical protein
MTKKTSGLQQSSSERIRAIPSLSLPKRQQGGSGRAAESTGWVAGFDDGLWVDCVLGYGFSEAFWRKIYMQMPSA